MPESMREAVEGFERDMEQLRQAYKRIRSSGGGRALDAAQRFRDQVDALGRGISVDIPTRSRFRRADVHDCITAANEQRQLAIASPKLAEQANALATRLSDLAERIQMLLEEGA
jgi:hypothetical protein